MPQEQERRRIRPVPILDQDDQRRSAAHTCQEIRDGTMQTVALGVRIGGQRIRQLADSLRELWQQARQLPALGTERVF